MSLSGNWYPIKSYARIEMMSISKSKNAYKYMLYFTFALFNFGTLSLESCYYILVFNFQVFVVGFCFGWGLKKLMEPKWGTFLKGSLKIGPMADMHMIVSKSVPIGKLTKFCN